MTATQAYAADLKAARALLSSRIAAIKAGDSVTAAEQIDVWVDDALNNEWNEGISVTEWAEKAATKVGI